MSYIEPFGVADLIVVKKRLKGYAHGEIAHIENVMAFEERERNHRQLISLVTTSQYETEAETERRQDLQTTEKYELDNVIKQEKKNNEAFHAGAEISGGFGPVSVSAYAKYDLTDSELQSKRAAEKYSKETINKAMEHIKERTKRVRQLVETSETEETNRHAFNNETPENKAGIYRWVDKKYLVKNINYGKRLFYELVIPEPAENYIFQKKWNIEKNDLPEKPAEPTILKWVITPIPGSFLPSFSQTPHKLEASDLDETNYMSFVSQYGVEDVTPPPEEVIFVTHSIAKAFEPGEDFIVEGETVKIPKGYSATHTNLICLYKSWQSHYNDSTGTHLITYPESGYPPYVKVQVGDDAFVSWEGMFHFEFAGRNDKDLTLGGLTESVPITCAGNYVGALALNIKIECTLSESAFQQWQLTTYQKIWTAYKRQMAQYEEKLSSVNAYAGVKISGDNPELNLSIIKNELKKSFINLWMREAFSLLPGWRDGNPDSTPPEFPGLLYTNADTNEPILRFLDSAFDWDNMSFSFMPYYFGRESRWLSRSSYSDNDPLFESFIKAGAARVRIPVDVMHTHAVLYYQLTNIIWSPFAGAVPALSSVGGPMAELYNSYLAEVVPEDDATDPLRDEEIVAGGDGVYEIVVPTNLVHLQADSALPGTGGA